MSNTKKFFSYKEPEARLCLKDFGRVYYWKIFKLDYQKKEALLFETLSGEDKDELSVKVNERLNGLNKN